MKRYLPILATLLITLPGLALAADCTTGSVATLLATNGGVCTIGDLSFDFTGYLSGGWNADSIGARVGPGDAGEYAASAVTFTPNSAADGFNLSNTLGNFSSSTSLYSFGYGELNYFVTATEGALTGVTTDINGASISTAPLPDGFSSGFAAAINDAQTPYYFPEQKDYGQAYVQPFSSQYYGSATGGYYGPAPGGPTYTNNGTTDGNSSSTSFAGVTSETGSAFIKTQAYNNNTSTGDYGSGTATASFTSADFGFVVTPTTPVSAPEPGVWWSLLAMGALAIVPIRRLQRR